MINKELCAHVFEIANGDSIVCNRLKHEDLKCEGIYLGSKVSFPRDYNSEYEIYLKQKKEDCQNERN